MGTPTPEATAPVTPTIAPAVTPAAAPATAPAAAAPAIARTDTETALASDDPVEVADTPAGTWQATTGPSLPHEDRFPIEQITPQVEAGRFPAKAVVGELVPVTAVAYREGH